MNELKFLELVEPKTLRAELKEFAKDGDNSGLIASLSALVHSFKITCSLFIKDDFCYGLMVENLDYFKFSFTSAVDKGFLNIYVKPEQSERLLLLYVALDVTGLYGDLRGLDNYLEREVSDSFSIACGFFAVMLKESTKDTGLLRYFNAFKEENN